MVESKEQMAVDSKLIEACKRGDLSRVKYWLTSPNVKARYGFNADVHTEILDDLDDPSSPILHAVFNGHRHLVDYLLASQSCKFMLISTRH